VHAGFDLANWQDLDFGLFGSAGRQGSKAQQD